MRTVLCNPAATYEAAKPIRIDGIDLQPGDLLPAQFTNRSPGMLDKFLRARMIQLAKTQPVPGSEPVRPRVKIKLQPAIPDLNSMTGRELAMLCKQRKLSFTGNKAVLRKRLLEAIGAVG